MNQTFKNYLIKYEIAFFYVFATGWTWTLWFVSDIFIKSSDFQSNTPIILQIIENPLKIYLLIALFAIIFAVFGPAITAFIFASITHGKEGRRYWIKKIFFWRIGLKWFGLVLLIAISIKYSSFLAVFLFDLGKVSFVDPFPILELLTVFILNLIPSGGQEEVGWRYIQLRLQERFSFPVTALLNGIMNWVWHIPLYLFFEWQGLFQQPIWWFLMWEIPLQFIFCYLTNATKSALPAIILHALFNTLGNVNELLFDLNLIYNPDLFLLTLVGVAYLIIFILFLKNGKNLSPEPIMLFKPEEEVKEKQYS